MGTFRVLRGVEVALEAYLHGQLGVIVTNQFLISDVSWLSNIENATRKGTFILFELWARAGVWEAGCQVHYATPVVHFKPLSPLRVEGDADPEACSALIPEFLCYNVLSHFLDDTLCFLPWKTSSMAETSQ